MPASYLTHPFSVRIIVSLWTVYAPAFLVYSLKQTNALAYFATTSERKKGCHPAES
jgi:hypothetical protein